MATLHQNKAKNIASLGVCIEIIMCKAEMWLYCACNDSVTVWYVGRTKWFMTHINEYERSLLALPWIL